MKTEILSIQIVDDDGETVLAKIECFDESSASVEINSVFTLAEWKALAAEVTRCMEMLELKTNGN